MVAQVVHTACLADEIGINRTDDDAVIICVLLVETNECLRHVLVALALRHCLHVLALMAGPTCPQSDGAHRHR